MVKIFSSSRYIIDKKRTKLQAEEQIRRSAGVDLNINIIFIGVRKMKTIAQTYKKENVALPVLSFPLNDPSLLGEVFICFPQVVLLAAEREKTVDKMIELMVEHGVNNLLQPA